MSLRAFRDLGVLGPESDVLGVGAGAEATIFWLTNHCRRVFATDLYFDNQRVGIGVARGDAHRIRPRSRPVLGTRGGSSSST